MKKLLCILLTIASLTTFVPAMASNTEFSDFSPSHWAYNSVTAMVNNDVIEGYPDGTFRPENNVTRGEFCAMLSKAAKLYVDENATGNHWATPYAETIKQATWTYKDWYLENGDMDATINRGEAALGICDVYLGYPQSLIFMTAEVNSYLQTSYKDFSDIGGFAACVYTLSKNGILSGYDDGCFHPGHTITRAELCAVLLKAFTDRNTVNNTDSSNTSESNIQINTKLSREDIEITLKPGGSGIIFVNKSSLPYSFSALSINGGIILRPYNREEDVIVKPGETKFVDWYYDGTFNIKGTDNGLNSYGYVVIEWNGKQYYADFTTSGITTFHRGNARSGPIAE